MDPIATRLLASIHVSSSGRFVSTGESPSQEKYVHGPDTSRPPFDLDMSLVAELERSLRTTFDVFVGPFQFDNTNTRVSRHVISPESFLRMTAADIRPGSSLCRILFYVAPDDWNACLDHYHDLKRQMSWLDACFVVPRKLKSKWKPWLNKLPYVHAFVKGTFNQAGLKLMTPLQVHRDRGRPSSRFSAFKANAPIAMQFVGNIAGASCRVALDSCASHSFINAAFLQHNPHKLLKSRPALPVELGDGSRTETKGVISAKLTIQSLHCKPELNVLPLASDIDIILGNDWLIQHQAILDFAKSSCTAVKGRRKITLKASVLEDMAALIAGRRSSTDTPSVLTALQFRRLIRKGAQLFVTLVKPVDEDPPGGAHTSPAAQEWATKVASLHPDIRHLLTKYETVFQDVPPGLPPDRPGVAHAIPLHPDAKPVFRPMYRLSPNERQEVETQIRHAISMGWLEPSVSPWGAPILFVGKKGGGLRMCIDYRALNKATVKNRYPLPRIDDLFDDLQGAKYFSSLDLASGYHQIRIPDEDRPKTAFRTPFGLFQYRVLSFGLTNAPATFQAAMTSMLGPLLRKGVLVYLDDILIYSKTWEEHVLLLDQVLERLQSHQYFCRPWKCHFGQASIEYLGHVISNGEIRMDPKKLACVKDWPTPRSLSELRSFLGFTNYFRKFIRGYSTLVAPMTSLTRKAQTFTWTTDAQRSFEATKEHLLLEPVLRLPDMTKPFTVVTDASTVGCGAVLLQDDHPIAFESRKFTPAECNYSTTEQEMLAAYYALQRWRCYLEGGLQFTLITDHQPNTFFGTQVLNRRQARWHEFFTRFHFDWVYKPGRTNIADPLSRLPGQLALLFGAITRRTPQHPPTTSSALVPVPATSPASPPLRKRSRAVLEDEGPIVPLVLPDSTALPALTSIEKALKQGYVADPWFHDPKNTQSLTLRDGLWWYGPTLSAVAVPHDPDLKTRILREAHDAPYSGHCGMARTLRAVSRLFWWPRMREEVIDYVKTCLSCQRNKALTRAPAGLLLPLDKPNIPWAQIGTDFITDLPKTTHGHDAIIVFVDHCTKMVHFVPTTKECSAEDFARTFVQHVFRLHGLPQRMLSDRGQVFLSKFWKNVLEMLGTHQSVSTAFHPQTGGQHERMNRVLEEMLRHYLSANQGNWEDLLPVAEFAINNSVSRVTGMTPFEALQGWIPRTPLEDGVHRESNNPAANRFIASFHDRMAKAKTALKLASDRDKSRIDQSRRPLTFQVGDEVLLSSKHIHLKTGPHTARKLLPQWIGPFAVLQVVNPAAYKLKLPSSLQVHPVFHVSLLKPYHASGRVQPPPPPMLLEGPDADIFQVDSILDHRDRKISKNRTKREYFVAWVGYGPENNTWEPASNLAGSKAKISQYLSSVPNPPAGQR